MKNEIHKNAFSKLIKETKQFAIKLRPRKAAIKAKFGFEDPSVTGYILALISIIYPFLEGQTEIIPDLEHKVFEMDLHIEGKIRLLYLFLFAFQWWSAWSRIFTGQLRHILQRWQDYL